MAALIEKALCCAIQLVVNKCLDASAEKLDEGGLTSKKISRLIEREVHGIKTTLEGIALNDLKTAIDCFEVGLTYLRQAIDAQSPMDVNAMDISLYVTDLETKATEEVALAKDRFKMARKKATAASNLDALSISDRIVAFRYRVMATIFEALGNPSIVLTECRHCLGSLHSLGAVQDSFRSELERGLLNVNRKERREIIASVCQINHVIYSVTQSVGQDANVWSWPYVTTGTDRVDPLRDIRITRVLHNLGIEQYCVKLPSFGQEGKEAHKLKSPWGIASNSQGNFIIADNSAGDVKVFDGHGKFQYAIYHPDYVSDDIRVRRLQLEGCDMATDAETDSRGKFKHASHLPIPFNDHSSVSMSQWNVYDVANDAKNNIYVFFGRLVNGVQKYGVFVISADQNNEFYLREELLQYSWELSSLTVSENNKILVRGKLNTGQHIVDVYKTNGQYVHCFGSNKIKNPSAIAAADGSNVMVLDTAKSKYYVRVFDSENGEQQFKFEVQKLFSFADIAFHKATTGNQIIVAGKEGEHLCILAYSSDGNTFLRSVSLGFDGFDCLRALTVSPTGHIGIVVGIVEDSTTHVTPSASFLDNTRGYKVLVV
ncbi:uncharacterized protein [Montipora foliosa]|uniref:uncharacterized protein n=1 Tax=Montipora foliosa TaxID=591990 RepID=UPI0035F1AA81